MARHRITETVEFEFPINSVLFMSHLDIIEVEKGIERRRYKLEVQAEGETAEEAAGAMEEALRTLYAVRME